MVEHADRLGSEVIGPALREMQERHPCVGDVRGVGAFWAVEGVDWPIDEDAWPRLRTVVRVERERILNGVTERATHYYVTSLPPGAKRLARVIRTHWTIENQLHWRLDVAFREDARTIARGNGAENLALLSKIALNLLQRETSKRRSLALKRKRAGWDNSYLCDCLDRIPTG